MKVEQTRTIPNTSIRHTTMTRMYNYIHRPCCYCFYSAAEQW